MSEQRDLHPELPVDPDAETLEAARPQHREPVLLGLVGLGGFVGTGVRYGVSLLAPTPQQGWPTATFAVNLAGAFLLGVVLEGLARRGPDEGRRRRARLLIGTGFCGALTTYSTLAVEVDLLARHGARETAGAYAVVSVFAGLLAAAAGVAVAAGQHSWAETRRADG